MKVAKSKQQDKNHMQLTMFLSDFTILPFDADDAIIAGKIRGNPARKGTPIRPYDLQIDAQGVSLDLTVITHKRESFLGYRIFRSRTGCCKPSVNLRQVPLSDMFLCVSIALLKMSLKRISIMEISFEVLQ